MRHRETKAFTLSSQYSLMSGDGVLGQQRLPYLTRQFLQETEITEINSRQSLTLYATQTFPLWF